MSKYKVHISIDYEDVIEAEDEEEALDWAKEIACEECEYCVLELKKESTSIEKEVEDTSEMIPFLRGGEIE